jgi:hypothetical protein
MCSRGKTQTCLHLPPLYAMVMLPPSAGRVHNRNTRRSVAVPPSVRKVERSGRQRPITPTQKLTSSLSDPGTMSMADPVHDKGKTALVHKFREREERWRKEQAFRDRESAHSAEHAAEHDLENGGEAGDRSSPEDAGEGGGS